MNIALNEGNKHTWWQTVFTKTVSRQLFWGVALTHAILMTIFVIDLVDKQQQFLYQQSKEQSIALVKTLAANGTSWILADDYIGMEEVINSQSLFPNLNFALFTDNDNKVLAHSQREHVGLFLDDETSVRMLEDSLSTLILFESNNQIDIATAVFVNGEKIGWARVSLNREHIVDNLQVINRNGYFYMLLAVAVGSLFAILLARGLTKAIRVMTIAANEVREGGREVDFDVQRIDELGELGQGFNDTVKALAQNEAALKRQQEGLEETVRERTLELEESNCELSNANELILENNEQIKASYKKLKEMQKQLVETEKMSALAYLVRGIAHEMNTPLGIAYTANTCVGDKIAEIENYLSCDEVSKEQLLEYLEEATEAVQFITKNIERSTLLVGRFKELDSQQYDTQPERLNMKEYVEAAQINLHVEELEPAINVNVDIACELFVMGNGKQLEQLFYHLFENSITHAFDQVDDRKINISANHKGSKVELLYRDNGNGMAAEQVEQVFNPFYTSKLGKGSSGLGMSVVYNIVKYGFNGEITCHSKLGTGVEIKVVFDVNSDTEQ
ncbi:ATP-binding protein [Vibrio kyushuensis]|uniref:sensor histidine kinase n=1 Tax=Vibrio kyushuensis TaxID=2910249 RepID=UPI003D0E73C7